MTLDTLNYLREANIHIYEANTLYDKILLRAQPGSQNLDGMPHGSGTSDKVADAGIERADLEKQIEEMKAEIRDVSEEAMRYISRIPDVQLAECFRLRFFGKKREQRPLEFKEIPDCTTKFETADSVKSAVYGYIRRHENDG